MASAPTPSQDPEAMTDSAGRSGGAFTIIVAIADIVVPIALYYLSRAIGCTELTSLIISSIAPIVSFIAQGVVMRRIDGFAIFIGAVLALNIAAAFTSADPRLLLARDGWITGLAGLFFLATLRARRPFVFSLVRPLGEGRLGPPGQDWDSVWHRFPLFRHVWRVLTIIWGAGLIVDAVIRVVFAYTLPVDLVPASNAIQYVIVYAILQITSQVYFKRSGILTLPGFTLTRNKTL